MALKSYFNANIKHACAKTLRKLKKWQGRKPLSVFESVIYLRNLPPGKERAALKLPVYLVLQARVAYPDCIAANSRGLLPRVFTLAFRRLFSVTPCQRLLPAALSADGRPFLCGLSSAPKDAATDRPAIYARQR